MFFSLLKKFLLATILIVSAAQIQTIQDYADQLPYWGTSWNPGNDSISGYYPSFYVGFAPRSEYPNRIHIRTSRGNQTRVSVILDEQTIKDYLFDLVYRDNFYKEATAGSKPAINTNVKGSVIPQLEYFTQVVNSSQYNIQNIVLNSGNLSSEELYQASLQTLTALNPNRIFMIDIDLSKEYARWQSVIADVLGGRSPEAVFTKDAKETIIALDTLVWGRVNITEQPSNALLSKLQATATLAMSNSPDLSQQATELFIMATGNKYQIKVLDQNGQWANAITCNQGACKLRYPEFTTIYPTGSAESFTTDSFKNRISNFATPGLWSFLDRSYHEVDHIRKEAYYGWAPKMDFEAAGNGFHNPAVRIYGDSFNKKTKEALRAPMDHSQLWAPMRGGVSHGCLRLALGHVWEMRHIMPVENDKMTQVYFFGNHSTDFDVYDVDGDSQLEVMGIEYQITYSKRGASGLEQREGEDLLLSAESREAFYNVIYGEKNVFAKTGNSFVLNNPNVSFPSHLEYKIKNKRTAYQLQGQYPLYEQPYDQDKVQLYAPRSIDKTLIRLMGRVRGCAPDSDKVACGEAAFAEEKVSILGGR